jgi:hypothetical protein
MLPRSFEHTRAGKSFPEKGNFFPCPAHWRIVCGAQPKANVERYDGLRSQIAGGRHAS